MKNNILSIKESTPEYTVYNNRAVICKVWIRTNRDLLSIKIEAVGKAVCSPDDEFDIEFGKKLAYDRAMKKAYSKLSNQLTHILKDFKKLINQILSLNDIAIAEWGNKIDAVNDTIETLKK